MHSEDLSGLGCRPNNASVVFPRQMLCYFDKGGLKLICRKPGVVLGFHYGGKIRILNGVTVNAFPFFFTCTRIVIGQSVDRAGEELFYIIYIFNLYLYATCIFLRFCSVYRVLLQK